MVSTLLLGVLVLAAGGTTTTDHDYKVSWPEGVPHGVVVFLHGVSFDPFDEEGEGMDALAEKAAARGLVAVFPIGHRVCDLEPPRVDRCWLLDQVEGELRDVKKIIAAVEKTAGVPLKRKHLIGFSNGGFLVAGALQRGLLDDFSRVGILSAGPVGLTVPPASKRIPRTFIEVGKEDRFQRGSTRQLASMLNGTHDDVVHFREVPGGHVFDGERAERFLSWFWSEL